MNLAPNPDSLKYIIETTPNKLRALRRFNQLQLNRQDIRMMVNADSTLFNLYFVLSANAGDTTRIKDSLRRFYGISNVEIRK
jgi:hypothetical protein